MDINPSPTLISASRGVRYAAVAALSLLAVFLLAQTWATLDRVGHVDIANVASITVTGTGKASVAPNIATINFTVQENATTVAAAQDSATKRTDNALAAIKKLGVEEKDIQTNGYNVSPQYETKPCAPGVYCPQNTNKISGYQVSQSIDVKVRDTKKVGDVLAALGSAEVQNVSGPNFMVEDSSVVNADARAKAIADARAKAEVLARQLGVHLGKVVGFSENGSSPYPMYANLGKAEVRDSMAPAAAPTVPTGQNESNISVTVVYEIK